MTKEEMQKRFTTALEYGFFGEAQNVYDELCAEIEQLSADAARYRWLREFSVRLYPIDSEEGPAEKCVVWADTDGLDELIDDQLRPKPDELPVPETHLSLTGLSWHSGSIGKCLVCQPQQEAFDKSFSRT
jgi:hypothetical protein